MLNDSVKNPSHYDLLPGHGAKDVIRAVLGPGFAAYCHGNALKYLLRAGKKGPLTEDMGKAREYITYLLDHSRAMQQVVYLDGSRKGQVAAVERMIDDSHMQLLGDDSIYVAPGNAGTWFRWADERERVAV